MREPFRITPLRPLEVLFREAADQSPPVEDGTFRDPDFVRLHETDRRIRQDIRYASDRNFLGTRLYPAAEALLQRPAADALGRVQDDLERDGLGLVVYDAYRPWWVTWVFWEATPPDMRTFVATPSLGSRHNRGCAVDVGLVDLASGMELDMPSGYDEFTERAYADFAGGSSEARAHRDRLIDAMARHAFKVYRAEWWHFDHEDWPRYAIQNIPFSDLVP